MHAITLINLPNVEELITALTSPPEQNTFPFPYQRKRKEREINKIGKRLRKREYMHIKKLYINN